MNDCEVNQSKNNVRKVLLRILIALILLAGFVALGILTFYYMDYEDPESPTTAALYCGAALCFLFGFAGLIIPKLIYKLFYKFGAFVVTHSDYPDSLASEKEGYKPYKITVLCVLIASYILAVITLLMSVF